MPFLQQQGLSSSSEEENSHTSFKIQDSRLDVLLKQDLSDDSNYNDENNMVHAHAGPRIEEINADTNERNIKKQIALENLLKNMQKSNESAGNGNSRNSTRSRHSRKSQATNTWTGATCSAAAVLANSKNRRSQRSNKSRKHNSMRSNGASTAVLHNHSNDEDDLLNISDLNLHLTRDLNGGGIVEIGDSITSSCTSSELDLPLGLTLHSSYSAHSTGKPNSRNSKTSCDVGIQANAFEIATHNLTSYDEDELKLAMRQLNAKSAKQKNDYANEAVDATEMHTLLRNNNKKHRETTLLSESEKLKLLLLPSK